MNSTKQPYLANKADHNGFVTYSEEEHKIWSLLLRRQIALLKERACDEYLHGLELLQLPSDKIPQCVELNNMLAMHTAWRVEPVPSVIPVKAFFTLLANRKFPVATFIRRREDLDYIDQPDIFHEVVGHCPLLTHPLYGDFLQTFGQAALNATKPAQKLLGRLFFFSVETGLIQTSNGLRIYGGGVLSSYNESLYALDSKIPERRAFNVNQIFETPYGLEEMQKIYYVIDSFETLYRLLVSTSSRGLTAGSSERRGSPGSGMT